jgi:hypothetical protein
VGGVGRGGEGGGRKGRALLRKISVRKFESAQSAWVHLGDELVTHDVVRHPCCCKQVLSLCV